MHCHSQNYDWWTAKHNWDGVTHWTQYITLVPAYMGPNALPVPDSKDGSLPEKTILELAVENHYLIGDNTTNLYSKLYIPLFSKRVGLSVSIVPIEYYVMDTLTRDIRRSIEYDGKGISGGDFYFGTYIQIVKDRPILPDILLTINFKTASGTNLAAARFTDTPGYFFDLSFGKDFRLNNSLFKSIRPFGLLGLYTYQTYYVNNLQNDAFLYGLGFNLLTEKMEIVNYLGGYVGYLNIGDRPMVYRLTLRSKKKSGVNYKLMFQQGIINIKYTTIRVGCEFNLDPMIKRILKK